MNALKDNPTVLACIALIIAGVLAALQLPIPHELWWLAGAGFAGSGFSAGMRNLSKPPPGYTTVPTSALPGPVEGSTILSIPPPGGLPR